MEITKRKGVLDEIDTKFYTKSYSKEKYAARVDFLGGFVTLLAIFSYLMKNIHNIRDAYLHTKLLKPSKKVGEKKMYTMDSILFMIWNRYSNWLVAFCNSSVGVGLYFGFLSRCSLGPSFLFLLRAQVFKKKEGTENKIAANTGCITGQLIMLISFHYPPLYLALGRPYTITVLALPYLFWEFFAMNQQNFLKDGSLNQNSMRHFRIQRIFLQNLLFQLFNLFTLPSSILFRLVNIYMFRCKNPFFFLTSSFVGWLIGHILFMKSVGLVLVWIKKMNSIKSIQSIKSNVLILSKKMNSIKSIQSIKSNVPILSNKYKYIMSELRHWMSGRIFILFLFISSMYYLRITPCICNQKLSESEIETIGESESEIQTIGEIEQKKSNEEYVSEYLSFFLKERENSYKIDEREKKDIFAFEKPLLKSFFDYKLFHRPLRYIKNDRLENALRNEMSQFFFHTSESDGKERISFTYPSSLSTFLEMMQRKISLFTTEKLSYDELDNHWSSINEQKRKNLSNQFLNRAEAVDKEFVASDVLEKRIRLWNDKTQKYLPKIYDPFLNGPYRGRIKKSFLFSIKNKTYTENEIFLNKIHSILINNNDPDFINNNDPDFEQILTDANDQTIRNRKDCLGIKENSKKVPRWSHQFIDEVEAQGKETDSQNKRRLKESKNVFPRPLLLIPIVEI